MNPERIISKILHTGRHLRLVSLDGWECTERVGSTGCVGVIAITPEHNLLLVEQYRPPVGARVIELPAGLVGDAKRGETPESAARRELREETGFTAAKWTYLGRGPSSAGLTSEVVDLFLAEELTRFGPGGGDGTEQITVHAVPLLEVDAWVSAKRNEGLMIDFKVIAGLYALVRRGLRK